MNAHSEHDQSTEPNTAARRHVRWQDMTWKDYVRITAGVVMFVLGIVGLVLPILQGVLFLIISAILLAPYSRWVSKQLDRGEQRFPWVAAKARSITQRWRRKADRHDPS
ncbi:hypothetical protein SADO_05870 [Salinisphaera dokdonensis CL-ES53]|uniref:Uncharacterized protein n=1 Tax=Salinisphaera dokdonensis CL-ES53 TaxID=1304272 RepID=A0ABV2B048_9GAMM